MSSDSEIAKKYSRENSNNEAWIEGLINTGIEINKKKPSDELISSIEDFGNSYVDLKSLAKKIKKMGKEEGFSELELVLLAREILQKQKRLSSRQLNYWFPLNVNWEGGVEQSTSHNPQFVNNDGKKNTEKSQGTSEVSVDSTSLPDQFMEEGLEKKPLGSDLYSVRVESALPTVKKPKSTVSFFDITDPGTIDCTNHPMYRSAKETILQLKEVLIRKDDLLRRLKVNEGQESEKWTSPLRNSQAQEGDVARKVTADRK